MQFCVKQCHGTKTGSYFQLRTFTSSQLQTSLRPFFFLCHPDLFMKFPEQRAINENSLQSLSAHLETLQRNLNHSSPPSLPFYLRNKEKSNPFRLVKVPLKERETKKFVMQILRTCDLDTSYVEKLKLPDSPSASRHSSHFKNAPGVKYTVDDNDGQFSEEFDLFQFKVRKAKEDETLEKFIKKNMDLAQIRAMALEAMREEVQKLKVDLEKKLDLKEIVYSCGWNIEHFQGCLRSLEKLYKLYPDDMQHIKKKTVIFSQFTGVSMEGEVHLFTGDVQNSWLDLIKNIQRQEIYLSTIPMYENTLSRVLLNIQITRRKFMPKTLAKSYSSHLSRVITNVLDYLSKNKFPKTWPENGLEDFELVIENESGPLMLSPTGQIIVPSTCPGFLLVDFISKHLEDASTRMKAYNKNKHIEKELHKKCIVKLGVSTLMKDDNVTPELMIECMRRLLETDLKFNNLNVHITTYFSVLSDGTICIPWNFKSN